MPILFTNVVLIFIYLFMQEELIESLPCTSMGLHDIAARYNFLKSAVESDHMLDERNKETEQKSRGCWLASLRVGRGWTEVLPSELNLEDWMQLDTKRSQQSRCEVAEVWGDIVGGKESSLRPDCMVSWLKEWQQVTLSCKLEPCFLRPSILSEVRYVGDEAMKHFSAGEWN